MTLDPHLHGVQVSLGSGEQRLVLVRERLLSALNVHRERAVCDLGVGENEDLLACEGRGVVQGLDVVLGVAGRDDGHPVGQPSDLRDERGQNQSLRCMLVAVTEGERATSARALWEKRTIMSASLWFSPMPNAIQLRESDPMSARIRMHRD